jgi:branched-chain amino acid transport system ATP-binding protein
MLEVKNLAAGYSGIQALRGVSFSVRRGEMVALIGPNGAGKSTLLNCLSGIVRPQAGSIRFAGDDITQAAPYHVARYGLLHVPEGRQILADLSVEENLLLGVLACGKRASQYSLDVIHQLFPVLLERRQQRAGSLSGGQQQMLAIGRALMGSPQILLLDEPSLGLSPLITDQVFVALKKLNQEGLTILLVEQNAHRALHSTTRAYVLEQGRIVAEGASDKLASDPRVIAHYLGQAHDAEQQPDLHMA